MRVYLIYNDSIVHQFDAVDEADARVQTVAYLRQKQLSPVILAVARRRITVTPPVQPPPTVDDQPA